MTRRLKIGIDIDNVIADSYPFFLAKFNEVFAMQIKYEEVFDFYLLEKYPKVSRDKAKKLIEKLLIDEQFQLDIPPFENALPIITNWKKIGHGVHYITSRPHIMKDLTYKWLRKHGFLLPGTTLDLFNSSQHFDKHRKEIIDYKKTIAQKRGVQLFIEDSKEIAERMQITVLLMDRPWNQGKLPKNVKRVRDWGEIDRLVTKINHHIVF